MSFFLGVKCNSECMDTSNKIKKKIKTMTQTTAAVESLYVCLAVLFLIFLSFSQLKSSMVRKWGFRCHSGPVVRLKDLQLQGCRFESPKLAADFTMTIIIILDWLLNHNILICAVHNRRH